MLNNINYIYFLIEEKKGSGKKMFNEILFFVNFEK